jgi:hypothetical protein
MKKKKISVKCSVAEPGCLSRIPDPVFTHPGSRISDPKTVTKVRGKKNLLSYFFCSHKFHKNEYYVIFEMLKKKIWANFQRIVEVITQKFSICSQKYGFGIRDPRSGKNLFRIPDPGVKKAPDPGSRSATLVEYGTYQSIGLALSNSR